MSHQIYHLVSFLVSANVVLWITPLVKNFGERVGKVDLPGDRKIHERPMVRLGGISIFLGTLTALLVVWWSGGFIDADGAPLDRTADYEIWGVTIGGLFFFLIGLADDLYGLSAFQRLFLETVVASAAWGMGVRIEFATIPGFELVTLPTWLGYSITILWLVGLTNAINWIDGMDGLAAGVSGIAAVVLLIVSLFMEQPAAALIAAALAGGALGFLRYNFNPAEIFMGDGGAYFMGFTLAGVAVIGLAKKAAVTAVFLPYLILAVPIVDMVAVIISRIKNGKSPLSADKSHLHHRLLDAGIPPRLTVFFIYSLTLWVGGLALAFSNIPSGNAYAFGATLLLVYASWKVWQHTQ